MRNVSHLRHYGDIELAVCRRGKGIPFVWGHGLMSSMQAEDGAQLWDWKPAEAIAQVIRYDARGHGDSGGSYHPDDYRWPHLAADMLAIGRDAATENGWQRSILGGMSMGAATALEAAVQHPEEVAGVVLVIPPTGWDTRPRQAAIYRRLAQVLGLFGTIPFHLLKLLPIPVREDGRGRLGLHVARGLARANPRRVQAALRGAALSDLPEPDLLAGVHVPTLILAWEDDMAHPVSTAEQLADCLPDVRELVICHPGDLSDWWPALLDFLQAVAAEEQPQRKKRRAPKPRGKARKR